MYNLLNCRKAEADVSKNMLVIKRLILILYDLGTIPVAWIAAYWVRQNLSEFPSKLWSNALHYLPLVIVIQIVLFWLYGLYRADWRFASVHDLARICRAVVVGAVTSIVLIYLFADFIFPFGSLPPRSVYLMYAILLIFLLGGARLAFRWFKEFRWNSGYSQKLLIVGAGQAGEALIRDLKRDAQKPYNPVLLVDDNPHKQGTEILGVRVRGKVGDIPKLVKRYGISQILIAIPAINAKNMRRIVQCCTVANIPYRTLPGLSALATGKITVSDLRDVSVDDLLGREPINVYAPALQHAFSGKKILITGGGGSIGSELCRQLVYLDIKQLIIVEHSEFNLYQIEMELSQSFKHVSIIPCLQSITNELGIDDIFSRYKPDVVFHAAAYKHVPLLEQQALVAVSNNVQGTQTIAKIAVKHEVKKFVLISTDKAVNPTNIMGTSKRIAEMYCQALNGTSLTEFITVRFGNVLGSAGSVVPLFKQQLEKGGPLTVTHPEITRYFMTIPEACQLVLQASKLGIGGEIFVLDMGDPIKINYLAEQIIKLSGKRVGEDVEIQYTGLRPGEKLYEELFHAQEILQKTTHNKVFRATARSIDLTVLEQVLHAIDLAHEQGDIGEVLLQVKALVPEANLNLR